MFINPSKSKPGRKTAIGMRMWMRKASLVTASGREDCNLDQLRGVGTGVGTTPVFFFGDVGKVVSPTFPNRALARGQTSRRRRPGACQKSGPISGATISKRQGLGGKVRVGDARCRSGNRTGKREFVENHGRE